MYTNTEATLYRWDKTVKTYERIPLGRVHWDEVKRNVIMKTGITTGDEVLLLVPYRGKDIPMSADGKSRIVRGNCEAEITADFPMEKLIAEHGAQLITSVDFKNSGTKSMWHWEVGAK